MSTSSPKTKPHPSPPRPCPIERFTGSCSTSYGGAGLWRRFLGKLDIFGKLLELRAPWEGRCYSPADYLYALLCALLLGLQRQSEVAELRADPGARAALGLEQVPSQPALSRFLATCCSAHLANQLLVISRKISAQMHQGHTSATIDLDGQVVSTRGNPERATFGYNPKRRGSKSYFVMMGILGECRDILDAWTFSGRKATVSAHMAIQAYRRSRRGLAECVRLTRLRADAAFFSHGFLSVLEHDKVTYFIPACVNAPLEAEVLRLEYRSLGDKWAIADFEYQAPSWKRPRRIVVVRERLDPQGNHGAQLTLLTVDGYAYQTIVTNSAYPPVDVWHFYNHRSCIENVIKESQYDFGCDHILSQRYGGNAVWLALSVLAYNLTNWFREKILNQRAHRKMAKWLRRHLINLPAQLVHTGRQVFLNLWRDHPSRALYELALARVEAFSP